MNTKLMAAVALVVGSATAWAQTPTAQCNPAPWNNKIALNYSAPENDSRIQAMIAAVQNPSSNPSLYDRMGRPTGVTTTSGPGAEMVLSFDPVQDPAELAARLRGDSQLAAPFEFIEPRANVCTPGGAAQSLTIAEYYNNTLNHYYLSANGAEMQWLDNGGGGGGWTRTGQLWTTHVPAQVGCNEPAYGPVYMFYGTPGIGPNSHYFTANPAECGYLRSGSSGWTYGGIPFGAQRPSQGNCPGDALTPMTMLFNNRAHLNDSNHRYTSDAHISESMQVQGWTSYGPQLCVLARGIQ